MAREYYYIKELTAEFQDKKVRVRGWVHRQRASKKIAFIVLRDGTGLLQCTAKLANFSEKLFEQIATVKYESSIVVSGTLVEDLLDQFESGTQEEQEDAKESLLQDRSQFLTNLKSLVAAGNTEAPALIDRLEKLSL